MKSYWNAVDPNSRIAGVLIEEAPEKNVTIGLPPLQGLLAATRRHRFC